MFDVVKVGKGPAIENRFWEGVIPSHAIFLPRRCMSMDMEAAHLYSYPDNRFGL